MRRRDRDRRPSVTFPSFYNVKNHQNGLLYKCIPQKLNPEFLKFVPDVECQESRVYVAPQCLEQSETVGFETG
jgi:hypothetical protein